MAKQIHQYLIESKQFRYMWADGSSIEHIVSAFEDDFSSDNLEVEVSVAIEHLDTEMKQSFLAFKYGDEIS